MKQNFPDYFDELRIALIESYNDLIKKLNGSIVDEETVGTKMIKVNPFLLKAEITELVRAIALLSNIDSIGEYKCSIIDKKLEVFDYI